MVLSINSGHEKSLSDAGHKKLNPAIRDSSEAFINYRKEGRYRPMRTGLLDYIALISIIAGFIFIFIGFLFGGILVPVGVFLELVASCVGRNKK